MANKKIDFDTIVKALDITPTMYKNAVDKYTAIAAYLDEQGIEADFYPQGSFRLGTVVRPLKNGKDADYDLDVVCQLKEDKASTDAKTVKNEVGNALKASKLYSDRLLPEDDRCWTLEYATVDGTVGFSLDVVPCVGQSEDIIQSVEALGVPASYAQEAIAITERIGTLYDWQASNPKGYALWFDSINRAFLNYNRDARRQAMFNENRAVFVSVEEIPEILERSALQRVIQILKRHRDLFYYRARKEDKKPISAIVTTLTAQIASHADPSLSTYELLEFVSNDIERYSALLQGKTTGYYSNYEERAYIKKADQRWTINNPVDPNDNYADSWDDETASLFFRWAAAVKQDFIDISETEQEKYYASLKNGMGAALVEKALPIQPINKPIKPVSITGTKPWRC